MKTGKLVLAGVDSGDVELINVGSGIYAILPIDVMRYAPKDVVISYENSSGVMVAVSGGSQ